MEKNDIIEFFDRCAASWDADMIKSDVIIGRILDNAEVIFCSVASKLVTACSRRF